MKQSIVKKISFATATALAMVAIAGIGTTYAAEHEQGEKGFRQGGVERQERGGEGKGMRSGEGKGKRGGHGKGVFMEALTDEERAAMRESHENLSEEERIALHETRKAEHEANRQAFEDFTGLTKDEVKEIRKSGESVGDAILENGKTESEIKNFLENQAEERVEDFVERFDVSVETETTLRAKIADFVENMFERLFKTRDA